ncbi:hypothetical protein [Candidatus Halobonum tyrrellensis]|uniref:Membrane-bound metal-dependent hydrolase n=1 Tax=Candidatus Halobonum tyrrellensis G22 TaxID=1324957 RepID=V4HGQ7_9EURY|nr:hypothetical protein [Candidatus Halobonum tyrrellensis]ESP89870.1 hypothetical protein K933_01572 [Candidatus Halobonum tyrrellensis G22]
MYSRHHLVVSAAVAAGLVAALPLASTPSGVVVAWGTLTAAGVLIDVDHFLVARLVRGDWANARRCLDDPRLVVGDQSAIFEAGDVWPLQRLLSHVLIAPAAVLAAWTVSDAAALALAVVLYAHLLCDLLWDVWRLETYHADVLAVARGG